MAEINVVPYIDVMLVLLVIFMITAPLLTQGVDVTLPEATAKAMSPTEEAPIIVSVDREGLYYLNIASNPAVPLTTKALTEEIAAQLNIAQHNHQSRTVLVKGDTAVNYGKVVQVMVLLQKAGVKDVGLLTKDERT